MTTLQLLHTYCRTMLSTQSFRFLQCLMQGASDHNIDSSEVPKGVRVRLRNGTVVEMYPTPTTRQYSNKKDAKELLKFFRDGGGGGLGGHWKREQGRELLSSVAHDAESGFHMCSRCRCCAPGSSTLCIRLPCCFSITCASPNQPFGLCSLTPFSCNCFSC